MKAIEIYSERLKMKDLILGQMHDLQGDLFSSIF